MGDGLFSIITGSGRYIPPRVVRNTEFLDNDFFDSTGNRIAKANEDIIDKFQQITDIAERRYADDEFVTSDLGYFAALNAIESSKTNKETFDYIIVAHNFGDVLKSNPKSDLVPSLAARIKYRLGIQNPDTIAYDLPFGCPGWLQAVIQADYFLKSGDAKRILVIGAETLSRISDPHDIDSMLYSDGAGAVILEAIQSDMPVGIIAHKTRSDTFEHALLLRMEQSYNPGFGNDTLFLKMNGRKLYEYALNTVPQVVKDCVDKTGLSIADIKHVLIHQANAKMDDAILSRLFKLYGIDDIPEYVMPMTIHELGNNSVATLPILYDLVSKGEIENYKFNMGECFVFASVGAGMNINAAVYKTPVL